MDNAEAARSLALLITAPDAGVGLSYVHRSGVEHSDGFVYLKVLGTDYPLNSSCPTFALF